MATHEYMWRARSFKRQVLLRRALSAELSRHGITADDRAEIEAMIESLTAVIDRRKRTMQKDLEMAG